MTQDEKRLLGVTAASHNLVHLYEGVLPPLIPILLLEFGTDYFHLGMVVTILSYGFGLGAIPAGHLADRLGPKRLIITYLFGSGLFFVGILAVNTLFVYGAVMCITGIFCSLYHPAANALIARRFAQKGKAFAINGIAGSLGLAVAPALSAFLGSVFGWKTPHVMYGLMGMALGWYGLHVRGEEATALKTGSHKGDADDPHRTPYLNLVIFYLTAVMLGITYRGIMTFLPAYMAEQVQFQAFGLTPVAIGGTFATFALMFGGFGQYVAGRLTDRYQPEKIYAAGLAIGACFVFMMAKCTNILLVVSAVMYAFFYFSTQPTQNYLIATYLPKNRQGLGFGIHFFLTFGVGSTAAAVSGYVADRFGLTAVFSIMGFFFAGAAILALFLLAKAPRRASGW